MLSFRRIFAVAVKETKQLSRDRMTFAMIVMIPLIQLLLFGYAINTDIRKIPVAVVNLSESTLARVIIEDVKASDVVIVSEYLYSVQAAEQAVTEGRVKAALILPPDLTNRVTHNLNAGQWIVDGSDSVVGNSILQLRNLPLPRPETYQPKAVSSFEVVLYFNPERRSAVNIVPGLLGVILTMTMVLFTSAALVRERERGNMELLITTPVKPMELMLAKITPYIGVGLIQVVIILGLGYVVFDVPINGSLLQIGLGTLLFIAASLALGLIISTQAKTQLQAMQMTIFVLLPSILLSGFMFPYEAMPVVAQWIAEAFPATHFMRLIRGVVLRGADLSDLWRDSLWLFVFTIFGLILASLRFKKKLD
jgi:ABC-2 type transport system permease protein